MRTALRGFGVVTLAMAFVWGLGATAAAAEQGCPETRLNVSGSHDSDRYVIPALERGETHQGRDVNGHEVAASCTAEGLEVEVDGKLVAIFSEDKMRVPGDDGRDVVIHRSEKGRGYIVVSSRDEKDLTINLREDGLVLLGEPDGRVLKLVIDSDDNTLTLRVESPGEE